MGDLWIQSHRALRSHPKTRRLARQLEIRSPEAVGILHYLWWWCLDYAPDGDLSKYDAGELADAAGWHGKPEKCVGALTDCGFLEDDGSGLHIHDWYDYGGKVLEGRKQDRERKAKKRHAAVHRTSDGIPPDGGRREEKRREENKELLSADADHPVDNSVDNCHSQRKWPARRVAEPPKVELHPDVTCSECGHVLTPDEKLDDNAFAVGVGWLCAKCAT